VQFSCRSIVGHLLQPVGLAGLGRVARPTQRPGLCRYVRTCVLGFRHGGAASALVESLLPGLLRERARVGTGQDHRGLDAVRLSSRASSPDRRTGRARSCVLCNAPLPVGLVQATARAGLRALEATAKRPVLSIRFDDRAGIVAPGGAGGLESSTLCLQSTAKLSSASTAWDGALPASLGAGREEARHAGKGRLTSEGW
jgi:hypothetical protein